MNLAQTAHPDRSLLFSNAILRADLRSGAAAMVRSRSRRERDGWLQLSVLKLPL